jgi:hypothetical protein
LLFLALLAVAIAILSMQVWGRRDASPVSSSDFA